MKHAQRGFTLIELLIVVVIIGLLASIAIPKFANTKEKAVLAGMKSDLRNLVTEQEGFFSDNNDYAGSVDPTTQVNGTGGAGKVVFAVTLGNALALTYGSPSGWSATMSNTVLKGTIQNCGIFLGSAAAPGTPPAGVQAGTPYCY